MAEIQTKKPFHNLNIAAGESVESEAYNLAEMRPEGRFAFQYTRNLGAGGLLKVTYLVSINGQEYDEEPDAYPVVEETEDSATGYEEMRPRIAGFLKLKATAAGGNIDNLNGWMAVQ